MKTYNHLNEYYKEKFNERTLKICIDASFTCPNRDGKKGKGGCIFCSSSGSGDLLYSSLSIKDQVKNFLASYKGKRANKFIVYFQNFTNTYAPICELKRKYDEALCDERIVGIDISTRPDAIDEEVCKLLASYKDRYYVAVELGLQTTNEITHHFINQNITNDEFIKAVNLLNKFQIDVIIHIMVGLPQETHQDIINTVNFLNSINYQGLKIHSTYVIKNTILGNMFESGKYVPLSFEEYIDEVIYILLHINENVIIHRITGDPPKDNLLAPSWTTHKKRVLNLVENIFIKNNYKQGMYFNK